MQNCRWVKEGFGNYGHGRCIEHKNADGQIIHLTCADCNLCLPPNTRPFGSHLTEFETVSQELFNTKKILFNIVKDKKNLLNQKSKLTSRISGLQKCLMEQKKSMQDVRMENLKIKNKIAEKDVYFSGIIKDKDAEILKLKKQIKSLKVSHAQENALAEQVVLDLKEQYEQKYEKKIKLMKTNVLILKDTENKKPKIEETHEVTKKKKKAKKKNKKKKENDDDAFLHEVDLQVKAYREGAEKLQKKYDDLLQKSCKHKTQSIEQEKVIVLLKNELQKEKEKFTALNSIKRSIMVYACQASMFCMFARMIKSIREWHNLLEASLGGNQWGGKNPQNVVGGFRSIILQEQNTLMNKNLAFNEIAEEMQLKVRQIVLKRRNACRIIQRCFRRFWRSEK